jgi:hypothetical protein
LEYLYDGFNIIYTPPKYIELLKQYYYVGGMPEVVANFIESNDFREVRDI